LRYWGCQYAKRLMKDRIGRLCVLALLLWGKGWAQDTLKPGEENFLVEVKQVDEFIERFNFDQQTLVVKYAAEHLPHVTLDRPSLILGMFNFENRIWSDTLVQSFIGQICDSTCPKFLNFLDEDWYAAVPCSVRYKDKIHIAYLTMQIQEEANHASKWTIRSVYAPFLALETETDRLKALNPISHATDFIGLSRALKDTNNLRNYLHRTYTDDHVSLFMQAVKSGDLEFVQVNSISYHFLQIEGYIFVLRRFLRDSSNSGWLIDELTHADPVKKFEYRKEVLHLR
ncbi:MAG: hypothetical protein AAFV07_21085, partial [Bacteroidota bacterium]